LPGALIRNAGLTFLCKTVALSVETTDTPFLSGLKKGATVSFPIAHHDGNYFADEVTLARLKGDDRIALRYRETPNGSIDDIAGILSENRRVLGLMPHPERAIDRYQGHTDGQAVFSALKHALIPA